MREPVPLPRIRWFIGIDPGFLGALAIIDHDAFARVEDAPILVTSTKPRNGKAKIKREYDLTAIVKLIQSFPAYQCLAIFEKVGSRPDQGVASMWSMGYGSGIWEMALAYAGIPYTRVVPLKWKNAMLEGVGHDKEASILRAQQLFPHVDLTTARGTFRDGRAEALLLAEYGRRAHAQGKL